MATSASFAEYVLEQIELPGRVDVRRMFGEYALYVDGKVVALLCDDQLFLKPLEPLRARLAHVDEAPPYPGAKPHFRIADELERPAELTALLVEAARLLPVKASSTSKAAAPKRKTAGKWTPTSKSKSKPKSESESAPKPESKPKSKPKSETQLKAARPAKPGPKAKATAPATVKRARRR